MHKFPGFVPKFVTSRKRLGRAGDLEDDFPPDAALSRFSKSSRSVRRRESELPMLGMSVLLRCNNLCCIAIWATGPCNSRRPGVLSRSQQAPPRRKSRFHRVRQGRTGTTQGVKFGRKPKLTDHQQGDLVKTIEVSGASISRTPLR